MTAPLALAMAPHAAPAGGGPAAAPLWPPAPGLPALRPGDRVHLVGLGGAGMSGLARALLDLGLAVSGSDRQASAELEALAAEGVRTFVGHAAEQLDADCRLVVRSPAVPDDNPELAAARAAGIPIAKRAVLLGALVDGRIGLAVAGTHGKTTSSGLLASVLERAGLAPSFFVGGGLPDLGTNARLGAGAHLVYEADEYDRSFLHGHPALAIVTNVEHDHPDIYPTLDEVEAAFAAFAERVRPGGRLIVNAASPGALRVAERARASRADLRVETYYVEGDPAPPAGTRPDWLASNLVQTPEGTQFEVRHADLSLGSFRLRLPGRHNVGNALAVIAAAAEGLGVDRAALGEALAAYRGAERRFSLLGRAAGVELVDDYAHHPTEIRATLEAARARFPGRFLVAVVQPHTYSRVALLAGDFAAALGQPDRVILTPVYAAREPFDPAGASERIAEALPGAVLAAGLDEAAALAALEAKPGAVLLFLGAGDIPRASRACLRLLRRRDAERLLEAGRSAGLGGEPRLDAALAEHCSLRVGGPADLLVRARSIEDLAGWWLLAQRLAIPVHVVGRGTNIVVADAGVQGLVLVNRCEAWSIEAAAEGGADSGAHGESSVAASASGVPADTEGAASARVVAEAGVTLAALGQALARAGWAGIEAGVGIPGSVGAGIVTNAGAHGWEMADSLIEAEVMDAAGHVRRWAPAELAFRYRGSALKGDAGHLVLRASLALRREAPAAILARIADYSARRRASQPASPSVGSIFKNPPGDHAGRLIEAAGLKGVRAGGAEVSTLHANFIINRGGATAADIFHLIERCRGTVRRRFGVVLEPEIEPWGGPDVA